MDGQSFLSQMVSCSSQILLQNASLSLTCSPVCSGAVSAQRNDAPVLPGGIHRRRPADAGPVLSQAGPGSFCEENPTLTLDKLFRKSNSLQLLRFIRFPEASCSGETLQVQNCNLTVLLTWFRGSVAPPKQVSSSESAGRISIANATTIGAKSRRRSERNRKFLISLVLQTDLQTRMI